MDVTSLLWVHSIIYNECFRVFLRDSVNLSGSGERSDILIYQDFTIDVFFTYASYHLVLVFATSRDGLIIVMRLHR